MTNRLWTNHENQIFVDLMPEYRKATYQQSIQTIRQVTKDYVNQLRAHPLITDRSQQAALTSSSGMADGYCSRTGKKQIDFVRISMRHTN